MNVKMNSSLNSPMKKTVFPMDIASFQNNSSSSKTTKSAQLSK
jgi:hypothetical protein